MDTHQALAEDDDGSSSHASSRTAPVPSSTTSVDIDLQHQKHDDKPSDAQTSPPPPPPTPAAQPPGVVLRAQSERRPPPGRPPGGAAGGADQHQLRALALAPRPFECLHAERAYLLLHLQRQDERARRLVCSLAAAGDRLAAAEEAAEAAQGQGGRRARKLRKQVAHLEAKVTGAAEQERLVLLRLGELYVEMQSRARWCAAQLQQRCAAPPPAAALGPESAGGRHSAPPPATAPLSPASPCFVPRTRCLGGTALPQQAPQPTGRCGRQEGPPPEDRAPCWPGRQAGDGEGGEGGGRPGLGARRLSLPDLGLTERIRERRMSLTALGDLLDD